MTKKYEISKKFYEMRGMTFKATKLKYFFDEGIWACQEVIDSWVVI